MGLNPSTPIVERALEIARTGKHANTTDVRKALAREGYTAVDLMHISPTLSMQIKAACKKARGTR